MFDTQINMWVYEEQVDGKNLTEIINETHVNVKYLPVRASPARPRGAPLSPQLPSLARVWRLRQWCVVLVQAHGAGSGRASHHAT